MFPKPNTRGYWCACIMMWSYWVAGGTLDVAMAPLVISAIPMGLWAFRIGQKFNEEHERGQDV